MRILLKVNAFLAAMIVAVVAIATWTETANADGHFPIPGTYDLMGRNPDGSRYAGTVEIEAVGDGAYKLVWRTPEVYVGVGEIKGGKLVVDWGAKYPAVYSATSTRGLLDGVWDNGAGSEVLQLQD